MLKLSQQLTPVFNELQNNLESQDIDLRLIVRTLVQNPEINTDKNIRKHFQSLLDKSLNVFATKIMEETRGLFVKVKPKEFYLGFSPNSKLSPDLWGNYQAMLENRIRFRKHLQLNIFLSTSIEERNTYFEIYFRLMEKFLDAKDYFDAATIHNLFSLQSIAPFVSEDLSHKSLEIKKRMDDLRTEFKSIEIKPEDIENDIKRSSNKTLAIKRWIVFARKQLESGDDLNAVEIYKVLISQGLKDIQPSLEEKDALTVKKIESIKKNSNIKKQIRKPMTEVKGSNHYWKILDEMKNNIFMDFPCIPDLQPYEFYVDLALKTSHKDYPKNQQALQELKKDAEKWDKYSPEQKLFFELTANKEKWKELSKDERIFNTRKLDNVARKYIDQIRNMQNANANFVSNEVKLNYNDPDEELINLVKNIYDADQKLMEEIRIKHNIGYNYLLPADQEQKNIFSDIAKAPREELETCMYYYQKRMNSLASNNSKNSSATSFFEKMESQPLEVYSQPEEVASEKKKKPHPLIPQLSMAHMQRQLESAHENVKSARSHRSQMKDSSRGGSRLQEEDKKKTFSRTASTLTFSQLFSKKNSGSSKIVSPRRNTDSSVLSVTFADEKENKKNDKKSEKLHSPHHNRKKR